MKIFQIKILIKIVALLFIFGCVNVVNAAALTCNGQTSVGGNYTIPHLNITVPGNRDGYTILYTAEAIRPGRPVIEIECNAAINFEYSLDNVSPGTVRNYNGYIIYPTPIKGIGVSVNAAVSSTSAPLPVMPNAVIGLTISTWRNFDYMVTIRLWKTPEFSGDTGAINFSDLTLTEIIRPNNAGDTIGTCPSGSTRYDSRTCIVLTRVLTVSGMFQSGTCDMLVPDQTVLMGTHHAEPTYSASPWKDATFQLKCPQAWGYGGKVANSTSLYDTSNGVKYGNSTNNQAIKIQIEPRSPVVNAAQGIFELNPGGAKGYGIQLAWGKPATQGSTPAKPVPLGTKVLANSLNRNFASGASAIGGYGLAVNADGTISMSARYVRTSGDKQPGIANGSVEVMASYE